MVLLLLLLLLLLLMMMMMLVVMLMAIMLSVSPLCEKCVGTNIETLHRDLKSMQGWNNIENMYQGYRLHSDIYYYGDGH